MVLKPFDMAPESKEVPVGVNGSQILILFLMRIHRNFSCCISVWQNLLVSPVMFQLLYNSQAGIWKCDVVTAISQMIYLSGNKTLILLNP